MPRFKSVGGCPCKSNFAVVLVFKKDREGIHRGVLFVHESHDAAAVGAAAQIGAKSRRVVPAHVFLNSAAQTRSNKPGPLLIAPAFFFDIFEIPVPGDAQCTFFVDEEVARTKFLDILVNCERRWDSTEKQ